MQSRKKKDKIISFDRIKIQRFIGWVVMFPLCGFLIFILKYIMRYKIEDMTYIRKQFQEIIKDKRPLLICANHFTFIDSCIIIGVLAPLHFYALNYNYFSWNLPAIESKKNILFRIITFLSKCVFIQRNGTFKHHHNIISLCAELILKGEIVTIFPEGSRSRTGRFNASALSSGVGEIVASVPDCRVLCIYLRSNYQKKFSNFPAKNSIFYVNLKVIKPQTEHSGKIARQDILKQISDTICQQENAYFNRKKPVALVTGASRGIGASLANEFAKNNFDLILVARDIQLLEQLKNTLLDKYFLNIHIISTDLSMPESINVIKNYIEKESLTVDALINNAGFGIHGAFIEENIVKIQELIHLQICKATELIHLFLPTMEKKRSGLILNVGSVYSFIPVPYQSIYGACKAFLLSFSTSLAYETRKKGIKITIVCPGTTNTNFRLRKIKKSGMSADKVARIAYSDLIKGKLISIPGIHNYLLVLVSKCIPSNLLNWIVYIINGFRGVNTK